MRRSVLGRILGPITPAQFVGTYFQQQPLLVRGGAGKYDFLFRQEEFKHGLDRATEIRAVFPGLWQAVLAKGLALAIAFRRTDPARARVLGRGQLSRVPLAPRVRVRHPLRCAGRHDAPDRRHQALVVLGGARRAVPARELGATTWRAGPASW